MKREKLAAIFLAAGLAIGLGATTNAMALVPNCSTVALVTESCGWVISAPGCYKLQNSLTATTNAGDCIQVNSPNVYLDLNKQTITGTGAASTGNGVHVPATSQIGAAIANVAIQGGHISGFSTGVMVGSLTSGTVTKVTLDNIVSENNNVNGFWLFNAKLSKLSGLTEAGIPANGDTQGLLINEGSTNHVSNSSFTGNGNGVFVASSNGNAFSGVAASSNEDGFVVEDSTTNQISDAAADINSNAGIVLLDKANANTVAGGHANFDNIGIWLEQSSSNEISGIDLSQSYSPGIYLGCDGPTTGTCASGDPTLAPGSNNNSIDANFNITTIGNPAYGIAIDKNNRGNTIIGNTSSGNATLDEYDGNACGVNNWFANTFGTSSAACVH